LETLAGRFSASWLQRNGNASALRRALAAHRRGHAPGGWVVDPDGLNPIALLNGHWPAARASSAAPQNVSEWLEQSRADVFFETSSLNPQSGSRHRSLEGGAESGRARDFREQGPVVHAYEELMTLARERGKKFLCEATVMDGVPIFSMFPPDCRQPSCADFPAS